MLAPARLSLRQQWFNLRWGAPNGRVIRALFKDERRLTALGASASGCFAFQINNTTRRFEFPWAFEALQVIPGLRILEIGGGLAGLQFVLDHAGCDVVNVDPGDELFNPSWPPNAATMDKLNSLLGTDVTMLNCFLHEAGFPDESFDRVVSISVFEHIPEDILKGILSEVRRVLKPGGLLVMTVDLFLDVQPFTAAESNLYGHNVSVKWIVDSSGLELVRGNTGELFGYPDFDFRAIREHQSTFLVGKYPAMAQALVLRKPQGQ